MRLVTISFFVLFLNLPFGYWRENTEKLSLQWILAVHLPVPVVIAMRIYSGLGWRFVTFPALIGAFFAGQYLGGRLRTPMAAARRVAPSSCLIRDLFHLAVCLRRK